MNNFLPSLEQPPTAYQPEEAPEEYIAVPNFHQAALERVAQIYDALTELLEQACNLDSGSPDPNAIESRLTIILNRIATKYHFDIPHTKQEASHQLEQLKQVGPPALLGGIERHLMEEFQAKNPDFTPEHLKQLNPEEISQARVDVSLWKNFTKDEKQRALISEVDPSAITHPEILRLILDFSQYFQPESPDDYKVPTDTEEEQRQLLPLEKTLVKLLSSGYESIINHHELMALDFMSHYVKSEKMIPRGGKLPPLPKKY